MTDYEAFQLELSLHMKTWRQLEQAVHWLQVAADTLDDLQPGSALEQQIRAALSQQAESERCTCPSGDGSLRWPCPAHKPAPAQDEREMGELRVRLENGRRQFEFDEYDAAYSLPAGTHYLYTRPAPPEQQ